MDAADLRATVEREYADELDRLGSRDLLVALSGGDPDPTALLRAAADSEYAARETFREWAATAADADLRETFEAVAAQEDDHFRRVLAAMDAKPAAYDPPGAGPMHAYLRGRERSLHRIAGGMVGRTLVSLRTHARFVDFFEADRAALFRDLREETATCLDDGLSALDARAGDDDWGAVEAVAGYTVRLAADDLQDALRELNR